MEDQTNAPINLILFPGFTTPQIDGAWLLVPQPDIAREHLRTSVPDQKSLVKPSLTLSAARRKGTSECAFGVCFVCDGIVCAWFGSSSICIVLDGASGACDGIKNYIAMPFSR